LVELHVQVLEEGVEQLPRINWAISYLKRLEQQVVVAVDVLLDPIDLLVEFSSPVLGLHQELAGIDSRRDVGNTNVRVDEA